VGRFFIKDHDDRIWMICRPATFIDFTEC